MRWTNGVFCPHCGNVEDVTRLQGKSHRPGLYQCNECREHFTVTVGTVMERCHTPLAKWVLAFRLTASSKKGVSVSQLGRMLGITYKSACFMTHHIREAMCNPNPSPIGGEGKIVEADEAYHGKKETPIPSASREGRPYLKRDLSKQKRPIVALAERGGEARAYHVPHVTILRTFGRFWLRTLTANAVCISTKATLIRPLAPSSRSMRRSNTPLTNTCVSD